MGVSTRPLKLIPLELMKTQSGFAEETEYVDMSKMREIAELLTSLVKTMKI